VRPSNGSPRRRLQVRCEFKLIRMLLYPPSCFVEHWKRAAAFDIPGTSTPGSPPGSSPPWASFNIHAPVTRRTKAWALEVTAIFLADHYSHRFDKVMQDFFQITGSWKTRKRADLVRPEGCALVRRPRSWPCGRAGPDRPHTKLKCMWYLSA